MLDVKCGDDDSRKRWPLVELKLIALAASSVTCTSGNSFILLVREVLVPLARRLVLCCTELLALPTTLLVVGHFEVTLTTLACGVLCSRLMFGNG